MMTMKKMALYSLTAFLCFMVSIANIHSTMAGEDCGTDLILALVFVYEAVLLIMVLIKSGKVRKYYDSQHLKFAQKLLGVAETVYVVILLNMLICIPRAVAFLVNAAKEPLRALKNALFFPWLYDYFKSSSVDNMAFAWILSCTVATTVFMFFAISKFYKAKKLAIFLDNRPTKKQERNVFQMNTDRETVPERQGELFEMAEDNSVIYENADVEEAELIPDEEEFKQHIHQISDLNPVNDQTVKEQRECPLCGSLNNLEDKQCSFCGAELEQ